jgi:diadenosine hexaphosphate hydrolase (ATP-forming)
VRGRSRAVPQAGAIAVRWIDGLAHVLLVRARQDPTKWIFPKGHIDPGETVEVAALRELREEGGVNGRILGPVGPLEFVSGRECVRVEYFAVEATAGEGQQSEESRERRWVTLDEAHRLLSFEDAKGLLAKALERMKPPAL